MARPNFLQTFVQDPVGKVRTVALAAEMAKIEVAQLTRHKLLRAISGSFIREVAVPAKDALLKAPRTMGAVLQHLDVVIGLQ